MSERTDVITKKIKIIECLSKKPMTTSELKNCSGISRDVINEHCKKLVEEGKILPKNGKFGKYRLNSEYYQNPIYKGSAFRSKYFSKFNSRNLFDNEFICRNFFNKDFQDYIKMQMFPRIDIQDNNLNEDLIYENQLYVFSMAIGAYITFALIYGMKPDIWNFKRDEIYRIDRNIPNDAKILGKDKEYAMEEWIKNCIDPIKILKAFSKLEMIKSNIPVYGSMFKPATMKQLLTKSETNLSEEKARRKKEIARWIAQKMENKYKEIQKRDSKKNPYLSNYEYVVSDKYEKLIKGFERLFPFYFKNFQEILQEIDNEFV